jgi:uncharacterized protein YbjT (DUF2867 family)
MTGDIAEPVDDAVPPIDLGPTDATNTVARRTVAVVGAGGFVGTNLVPRLVADGFHVHALLRDASGFHSRDNVEVHVTDVSDRTEVARALTGCEVAYYLVHAMAGGDGFAERDRSLAVSFANAAADAGVGRIVYLGGLGHEGLSTHLSSRQEVGGLLGSRWSSSVPL